MSIKRMIKFGSISQFRNIVKDVQHNCTYIGKDEEDNAIFDETITKPIIEVVGTEKIHGTNGSVCFGNNELWVQSKNNIITVESDNNGCANFVEKTKDSWMNIIETLKKQYSIDTRKYIISVFFEFAGGNIQRLSACSGLDKRAILFRHFKVSPIDTESEEFSYWLETKDDDLYLSNSEENIFNIMNYKHYKFKIDFNRPEEAQNNILDIVLNEIEPNSSVGKEMGIDGNVGEGLVLEFRYNNDLLRFKVKGEKHSNSKVKMLKYVDLDKVDKVDKCVEAITHEWRFIQGLTEVYGVDYDKNLDRKKLGEYIKWINKDTLKEELDIIQEHNFEPKDVLGKVSTKAKEYYFQIEKL